MGLFDRFRSGGSAGATTVSAYLYPGDEDLEVVGESYRQDTLWSICSSAPGDRVRHEVVALLVPDPQNPHDPNAIAVHVDGGLVGYLARDTAVQYGPGLHALMARCDGQVALPGWVVGGGYRDDRLGMLGVWLEHDPRDFGLEPQGRTRWVGPATRPVAADGTMRTGFTEAWLTDVDDDSYDLSWFDELPDADRPAIALLRDLLATDPDPIDRHFQFAELEVRLYRCRDLFDLALDEFDAACELHDEEIDAICQAFHAKWGKVPLLVTYRQMAIRRQKQKDWQSCLWWAERGLAVYGDNAARQDAVEDLLKRRNRAIAKLEAPTRPTVRKQPSTAITIARSRTLDDVSTPDAVPGPNLEVLVCSSCNGSFERVRVPGRKPSLCPDCRSSPDWSEHAPRPPG